MTDFVALFIMFHHTIKYFINAVIDEDYFRKKIDLKKIHPFRVANHIIIYIHAIHSHAVRRRHNSLLNTFYCTKPPNIKAPKCTLFSMQCFILPRRAYFESLRAAEAKNAATMNQYRSRSCIMENIALGA